MAPNPAPIYHITPIENLRRILEAGELRAKEALDREDTGYANIAHRTIQDRRAHTPVPCGPGGWLHDYVPFYFGPRSPMLYTISRGNVEGFAGGQQPIVHLVSTVQSVQAAGLEYVFTDGHGIMAFTEFYDDPAQLDEMDWPLMNSRYWFDTDDDLDCKRRRQAEFLIHRRFPVRLIHRIGVIDQHRKTETEVLLAEFGPAIPVAAETAWYY